MAVDNSQILSRLEVVGVRGPASVSVTLHGVTAEHPDDLDVLLVGPDQQSVALVSDSCGTDAPLTNATLTFDSASPFYLPDHGPCRSGLHAPTDHEGQVSDAYLGYRPTASSLVVYEGINPNGMWSLIVSDDSAGSPTRIDGGWSIDFEEPDGGLAIPGGPSSDGVASEYPLDIDVATGPGVIADVDVLLTGVYHTWAADLDLLLVGPEGQRVILMSDACVRRPGLNAARLQFDDEAATTLPNEAHNCASGAYLPTDNDSTDSLPAPAPAGPYGTSLSVFDGTNPNGTWRLYAIDDESNDAGFLTDVKILVTLKPAGPQCQGKNVTVNLAKGQAPTNSADVILGTSGADTINGLGGNDTICAAGGNDVIQGGPGNDITDGGPGTDTASYATATNSVSVSLATTGAQDTGTSTGIDTVRSIENLTGSTSADTLAGSGIANKLAGGAGNDRLNGAAGDDTLTGGPGTDDCDGGSNLDVATTCETTVNVP